MDNLVTRVAVVHAVSSVSRRGALGPADAAAPGVEGREHPKCAIGR